MTKNIEIKKNENDNNTKRKKKDFTGANFFQHLGPISFQK